MNFERCLRNYLEMGVGDVRVSVPYWMNRRDIRGYLGGKGRPEEIQGEIDRLLVEAGFMVMNEIEAVSWLRNQRVGIDCSGFCFAMSEALAVDEGRESLESWITPTPGGNLLSEKRFRTNADYLTSEVNSVRVEGLGEMRRGDLIRLQGGKHVAIIVEKSGDEIVYAHASRKTEIKGVHVSRIRVMNWNLGLEAQVWEERWHDGRNYQLVAYDPSLDGVWRLKR